MNSSPFILVAFVLLALINKLRTAEFKTLKQVLVYLIVLPEIIVLIRKACNCRPFIYYTRNHTPILL